ncbi:restriction endonuclease subunit S [Acidithiobacillus ferruginosus]|uniref:Restriction endonuclease subunit S n=1 Tax=Acidithiobacillus ferruginosus TaxID=3063951 RepID=A0ACD5IHM3_9PROT|nr:restriction endonuclease subunit S [Acidithiobacillus ferruginosus]
MTEGKLVPYLRVANVFDGSINFSDVNEMPFKSQEIDRFRLIKGDILLNEGQSVELVGRCAMFMDGPEDCCYQNTLVRYRASPETDPNFALQLFRYCQLTGVFSKIAVKTNSIAHLGVSRFAELELPFPPYQVQNKIAGILERWDTAIQKTEQLIAAKERHYSHELSRLISLGQYPHTHIGAFAEEVSARNRGGNEARVLSVTNSRGFVLPEDQFERRVASADLSNYKVVRRGQYAYNPSRINVGSIARLDGWDHGVLSPMYVVFRLDEAKVDSDYFLHWLNSHEARQRIKNSAQGSVRETVSFSEFAAITIPLLDRTRQTAVARYLNALREEIDLLGQSVAALKTQKRGLMQKLLTGQWRLHVSETAEETAHV